MKCINSGVFVLPIIIGTTHKYYYLIGMNAFMGKYDQAIRLEVHLKNIQNSEELYPDFRRI